MTLHYRRRINVKCIQLINESASVAVVSIIGAATFIAISIRRVSHSVSQSAFSLKDRQASTKFPLSKDVQTFRISVYTFARRRKENVIFFHQIGLSRYIKFVIRALASKQRLCVTPLTCMLQVYVKLLYRVG